MAEDGVEKSVGSAVVHKTRVQADSPERGGADFVGGIVVFGAGEIFPGDGVHVLGGILGHGLDGGGAGTDIGGGKIRVGGKLRITEGRGDSVKGAADL